MTASQFYRLITAALIFISTFTTVAVFRQREFGDNSVDFQILLKLSVFMASFAYGMIFFRQWAVKLFQIDTIFLAFFLIWVCITTIYSPSLVYSMAAAFSIISLFPLYMYATEKLDVRTILSSIFLSCTFISFVSIVVYFIHPELGRMKAWINGIHIPGNRLSGITETANAIGYVSAFGCLLMVIYRLYYVQMMPKLFYLCFAINILAQLMSNSRASLAALIMAIGVGFLMKLKPERLVLVTGGICVLLAGLYLIDLEAVFAMLSRSGNAEEIMTGTGRTYIWSQTIQGISQKPFFGWGYGSTGFIMPAWGFTTPHAHNMILQVLFTTGLIGVLPLIAAIVIKTYYTLKFKDQAKLTLLFFFLVQGLFEPAGFRSVADMSTIVFVIIMALPYHRTIAASEPSSQPAITQPT